MYTWVERMAREAGGWRGKPWKPARGRASQVVVVRLLNRTMRAEGYDSMGRELV